MAYSVEQIETKFNEITLKISRDCLSLRKVLIQDGMPSSETFYKWLDADKNKSKQYARACEDRHDILFDEIIEIADENDADVSIVGGEARIDGNTVQRSRLKIDARKWALSKMNPKKYGDKIEATIEGGDKPVNIVNLGGGVKPD
tara:strand:- start:189 stop:623 length:435 start_codon:yes stop_codon:yes gene_type:complete